MTLIQYTCSGPVLIPERALEPPLRPPDWDEPPAEEDPDDGVDLDDGWTLRFRGYCPRK